MILHRIRYSRYNGYLIFALFLLSYGLACLVSWLLGGPALGVLHFLVDIRDWNPGWQGWVGLGCGFVVFTVANAVFGDDYF